MIENNLLTVVGNEILEYPNELGIRHLDRLNEACRDLNLITDENNEVEVAIFLASNNNIVIMNSYGAILLFVPEKLNEFQHNFLLNKKELLYKMLSRDEIIEILITTEKVQDYNKKNYRNLGIEQQISGYEGKNIDSQLDILYGELESEKMNIR